MIQYLTTLFIHLNNIITLLAINFMNYRAKNILTALLPLTVITNLALLILAIVLPIIGYAGLSQQNMGINCTTYQFYKYNLPNNQSFLVSFVVVICCFVLGMVVMASVICKNILICKINQDQPLYIHKIISKIETLVMLILQYLLMLGSLIYFGQYLSLVIDRYSCTQLIRPSQIIILVIGLVLSLINLIFLILVIYLYKLWCCIEEQKIENADLISFGDNLVENKKSINKVNQKIKIVDNTSLEKQLLKSTDRSQRQNMIKQNNLNELKEKLVKFKGELQNEKKINEKSINLVSNHNNDSKYVSQNDLSNFETFNKNINLHRKSKQALNNKSAHDAIQKDKQISHQFSISKKDQSHIYYNNFDLSRNIQDQNVEEDSQINYPNQNILNPYRKYLVEDNKKEKMIALNSANRKRERQADTSQLLYSKEAKVYQRDRLFNDYELTDQNHTNIRKSSKNTSKKDSQMFSNSNSAKNAKKQLIFESSPKSKRRAQLINEEQIMKILKVKYFYPVDE